MLTSCTIVKKFSHAHHTQWYWSLVCFLHIYLIYHAAWPVDFNLALPSFEPNIKGLRGLIDLALSSPQPQPPKFIYMSSVGIFQSTTFSHLKGYSINRILDLTPTTSLAERPVAAEVTTGTGYTESKWVAEQILIRCADQTPLKPVIVRVGQLCGGPNGSWNIKEWFPSIVHGSCMLGLLPADNKVFSFIPAEHIYSLQMLVRLLDSSSSGCGRNP